MLAARSSSAGVAVAAEQAAGETVVVEPVDFHAV